MTVRQRLCDALCAAGRIKEAGKALLNMLIFFDEDVYMAEPVISWFSGRSCCLVLRYTLDIPQQIFCNDVSPAKTVMIQPSPHCHCESGYNYN